MIKPEGYKVLLKPEVLEEKTEGGIIMPAMARDVQQRAGIRGEIVAIGPKANIQFSKDRPARVGDRVLFARYGGYIIEEGGVEFRVLNDEDVVGLIE